MTKLERTTRFLIKAKPLFSEKPIEVSIFENRKQKVCLLLEEETCGEGLITLRNA